MSRKRELSARFAAGVTSRRSIRSGGYDYSPPGALFRTHHKNRTRAKPHPEIHNQQPTNETLRPVTTNNPRSGGVSNPPQIPSGQDPNRPSVLRTESRYPPP